MAYSLAKRIERAVKNAGVKYKEVSGWESRGHGAMQSIESIMCHHTAGPKTGDRPSLNVVAYGRAGLSGPLSQLFLSRDGTVYLVAAGISYHAGKVSNGIYTNSHSIGIEAEATGVSSWPDDQVEAYAKLCKALIKEFGLSTSRVVGHKEAASPKGRKIDPNFSMNDFRKKIDGASGGVSQSGGSTGGSSSSPKYKTVKYGTTLGLYDKGAPVKEWQKNALGYSDKDADGFFGPQTKKDTIAWQKKRGLVADGLVGEKTWAAYKDNKPSTTKPNKPKQSPSKTVPGENYDFPLPSGYYFGPKSGDNKSVSGFYRRKFKGVSDHTWLKRFANQLSKRGWNIGKGKSYLNNAGNDGKYGSEYAKLVKAFQKDQGLTQDGLIGKKTWDAAFKNPVT